MLKVALLSHTPNPELTVASAAKLCYSPVGVTQLQEKMTEPQIERFVDMLTEIGHESPIEHASFTFGIEGVSRSLLAQITRHRMASFSVQSQRYVREGEFEFIVPPEIENEPKAKEIFLQAMEADTAAYNQLTDILKEKHKQAYLDLGEDEKTANRKAEKQAIEDARFVLPNAAETKMVVTMNARSLYNFFKHRLCNRAQWEIRALASEMLKEVLKVAPNLFKKAGPPCTYGPCTEGKMTCGKINEVRAAFKALKGE